MKVERFLREYASYQKRWLLANDCMNKKEREKWLLNIDRALSLRGKILITVDETLRIIMNVV